MLDAFSSQEVKSKVNCSSRELRQRGDFDEVCEIIETIKKPFKFSRVTFGLGILSVVFVLCVGMSAYVYRLSQQLTVAFCEQKEYHPSRIYSDVIRIVPGVTQSSVEARLHRLSYVYQTQPGRIQFQLHPLRYPKVLLPENHWMLKVQAPEITLLFSLPEGKNTVSRLSTIQVLGEERPDFYLEPEWISTLLRSSQGEIKVRTYLPFQEIPAWVWKAVIAIEDHDFLKHGGFDLKGLLRAFWTNVKTFSFAQGGSTITQQLVKNLMDRRTKNLFKKFNELCLSILLEARFEKRKILERYLNEVYLGQSGALAIHGIAEGARYFFGKPLQKLNLAEISLMVGLIQGPSYYSPYRHWDRAVSRQHRVLNKMVENGHLAAFEAEQAKQQPLVLVNTSTPQDSVLAVTDTVKAELLERYPGMFHEEGTQWGFSVYTSLDPLMQQRVQKLIPAQMEQIEKSIHAKPGLECAMAIAEHSTGHILALIAGKNASSAGMNRILNMKRQVGSTFKPIVYLSAFQKGLDPQGIPYTPGHPAEDRVWKWDGSSKGAAWSPRNYTKTTKGWTSYRTALRESINTIAAQLGVELGIENVIQTARSLGIHSALPAVPALSLGVAELPLLDLLQAYATIANRGIPQKLELLRALAHPDQSIDFFEPKTLPSIDVGPVELVHDMLHAAWRGQVPKAAEGVEFFAMAGKTGTTSDHRDAWFAGYTPELTAVVWIGRDYFQGADPLLTGTNAAFPLWWAALSAVLHDRRWAVFPPLQHIQEVMLDRHTGRLATAHCPEGVLEKILMSQKEHLSHIHPSCEPHWPKPLPSR